MVVMVVVMVLEKFRHSSFVPQMVLNLALMVVMIMIASCSLYHYHPYYQSPIYHHQMLIQKLPIPFLVCLYLLTLHNDDDNESDNYDNNNGDDDDDSHSNNN